jgi:CRISPR-associated endonuclease Csn1
MIIDPVDRSKRSLTDSEWNKLWGLLNKQKTLLFSKIRTCLDLPETTEFNLETDRRKELKGNETAFLLRKKDYFGSQWDQIPDEEQDAIVESLLEIEKEENLTEIAQEEWKLPKKNAEKLAELSPEDFVKGYARYSKPVMQRLAQLMSNEGYAFYNALEIIKSEIEEKNWEKSECTSSKEPSGSFEGASTGTVVLERTQASATEKAIGSLVLPYYGEVLPESCLPVQYGSDIERRFGRINNPTVHIGLNQLRLVINAILKRYRLPTQIVVELARDLKLTHDEKEALAKEQRKNQQENDKLNQELESLQSVIPGLAINGENRLKLRLWKELNPDPLGRCCPYSGKHISVNQLFSQDVEIEHILPFALTLDDSKHNKTIAFVGANRDKRNHSPYKAFGHNPPGYDYEGILKRVSAMPKRKRWRFDPDAMERFKDENRFLDRQLTDTRYISKVARKYLMHICPENNIWVIPGQLTAMLRRRWGLNTVLNNEDAKNRTDHRHHAIDAIVTALTDRGMLQSISRLNAECERNRVEVQDPWEYFRQDVDKAIKQIVVSHRPDHSVQNALHEDMAYGVLDPKKHPEVSQGYNLVRRKFLRDLSKNEVGDIRDEKLRDRVLKAIDGCDNKDEIAQILSEFSQQTGIRRVRLLKKYASVRIITHHSREKEHSKAVIPGETHHIEFWKLPSNSQLRNDTPGDFKNIGNNLVMRAVSFFDVNHKSYVSQRPHPAAKLLYRLHKDDMLALVHDGEEKIVKITGLNPSESNQNIKFTEHNELVKDSNKHPKLRFGRLVNCQARKIHVDVLGNVKDPGYADR